MRYVIVSALILLGLRLDRGGGAAASNILIYSTTVGHSHVRFHNKLADLLVETGHKVVILLSEQNPNIKIGETKAEVITVSASEETIAIQDAGEKATLVGFWTSDIHDLDAAIPMFTEISNMATSQCRKTLDFPGLFDRLKQYDFDVALSEAWDLCGFGFFHRLGITKYAVTMTNHLDEGAAAILGVPNAPSWVPGVEMDTSPKMTFMERLQNLRAAHISHKVYDLLTSDMQNIFDQKYGGFASFKDLLANSSLVFTNSDPLIDFPRPTLHKVINLGGITVPPRFNNLTSDWEKILSERPRTVLVSFGTVAKAFAMPDDFKKGLMGAFDEFPDVTFIMKYEKPEDGLNDERKNVVLTKWMPQNELLGDERVVAMITHCGAASMHETAARGVPVVAVPLFHDQMRNARIIENAGFGVYFDKLKLNDKGALGDAIREVVDSKKYKKKAEEVAAMIQNRPFSPEELFVKNVEFLASHGPLKNLDPYSRHMGWLEYYNADILLALLGIALFILVAFALCLCLGCFFVQQRRTKYQSVNSDDYFLHA